MPPGWAVRHSSKPWSSTVTEHLPTPTLGIVGPGLMGLGMAQVAVAHGMNVRVLTRHAGASEAARARWQAVLQRQSENGRLDIGQLQTRLSAVHFTGDVQDLAVCAAVIESVPEDRALKESILQQVETVLAPHAWLASNTSGLPISGLARPLRQPERFIGLHFFSPVERMPLVEVVRGKQTSTDTLASALALVKSLGQQPIVVRDGPGFFTSRVFAAYLDEALAMVDEGVDPSLVEQAAQANGRALGPLAILDEVSLQLNLQQARQARADGLPERFCRPLAEPVLARLVTLGRAGRRQGGGFYEVSASGERSLWSGLSTLFPKRKLQPALSDVQQRLRCSEALQALQCLEEGVIARAEDADLASVLGLGFPKSRGGVLRDVEAQGLAAFASECMRLAERHGARFEVSAALQRQASQGRTLHNMQWSSP